MQKQFDGFFHTLEKNLAAVLLIEKGEAFVTTCS